MNWAAFASKIIMIIPQAVAIVQNIKKATGPEKKQAVIDSIPTSIELVEFAAGRDILNDPGIRALVSACIDIEKAALKAREALRAGILAKTPPVV